MSYRVMVTGSRSWNCIALARRVITGLVAKHGADNLVIVVGDCDGVDAAFHHAALDAVVQVERFQADWGNIDRPGAVVRKRKDGSLYDAAAGPERNAAMLASGVNLCLAFHQFIHNSKGTRGAIILALKAGVETWLVASEDGKPVKQELGDYL